MTGAALPLPDSSFSLIPPPPPINSACIIARKRINRISLFFMESAFSPPPPPPPPQGSPPTPYLSETGEAALAQVRTQLERAREMSRRLALAIYEFKDGTDSQTQVNSLL